MRNLECNKCGKHMAELRDATVRKGIAVYCIRCNKLIKEYFEKTDIPDFMKSFFGSKA